MANLPYIPINIPDYLADTWHLDTTDHGAYLLLIMNYWQTQKPIPENRVQGITRLDNDRYNSVMGTLKEFFQVDENGDWFHPRINADLQEIKRKSELASIAGKKSAEKRWGKTPVSSGLDGSPITNPQRESNERVTNKNKSNNNTKVFTPPTLQEITEYAKERNSCVDPDRFFNFYESKGWMVGKSKMKKWKSAFSNWETDDKAKPTARKSKPSSQVSYT